MDWNRPGKLIRPNPDWEEDLFRSCEVTPDIEKRIDSYTAEFKKRKAKKECCCQERSRPGVAPRVTLNNGRTMPCLGIGTWLGLDNDRMPVPVTDFSMQLALEVAIDEGYRLIDTAPVYKTEDQVGNAVRKKIAEGVVRREDLFIVTKLPNECHAVADVVPTLKRSLKEMQLDYVDLYLIHYPIGILSDGSFDDTDYLETWKSMIEARDRGLTKAIGVSNFNLHQLHRIIALSSVKPAVLQIEVNLNIQQAALIQYCQRQNIVVMAHTPFGSLFHMRSRPDAPPPRTNTLVLMRLSEKYNKTVPQVALRYLLELGVVPIPKSVKSLRIQANIQVFDFRLTKEEMKVLAEYERNYRTRHIPFWKDSPYYPFEK